MNRSCVLLPAFNTSAQGLEVSGRRALWSQEKALRTMANLGKTGLSIVTLLLTLQSGSLFFCVGLDSFKKAHLIVNPHGICATFVSSGAYDCTEFMVPTEDGFLLSVQRMASRGFSTASKEPVFLYHGVMEGGESWFLNEPKESLAFMLMDSGHDVWIGNTRTTMFSYGHSTYTRSQKGFWDWCWDDLVDYDLLAMLHFINNMTRKGILYVGYSQGTMSGFAAFTKNEIANLVKKAVMFNPVAYLDHVSSPIARAGAWLFLDQVDSLLGMYEFNPSTPEGRQLLKMVCKNAELDCRNLSALVEGQACCANNSRAEYYDRYIQSTSVKNMAQLAQLLRSGRFGKYDYGVLGNLGKYWSIFPPSYDLSAIPERLSFFLAYGGNDLLADAEDVIHVGEKLPGNVTMFFMPRYNHQDFVLGTSAYRDAYPRVLEFLR